MQIKDIMHKPAPTARAETTMHEVARSMLRSGNGCVVVVDSRGRAQGLLTVRDFVPYDPGNPLNPELARRVFGRSILRHGLQSVYADARTLKAGKLMRPLDEVTLSADDGVERGVDLMLRHDDTHLPVLRGQKPVGTVSRHDLLKVVVAATPSRPARSNAKPGSASWSRGVQRSARPAARLAPVRKTRRRQATTMQRSVGRRRLRSRTRSPA